MRNLAVLLLLPLLHACAAAPLPTPDPNLAWVDVRAVPVGDVSADRLDGKRVDDARYFQVGPGLHELDVRYQYEVNRGGGVDSSGPSQVTCYLRVRYDGFVPGQRYRLEARPLVLKAQGWLYGEGRELVASAQLLRCGPY
ncbi:hypothetical protein [Pseudomonas sp.]|uniref:PA0061/PA0062 family lipoprotein n=1 Tax=Pseudomonas sp. TaxID=306 RepID=UPI0028B19380|nr:hypothetical protein [Pseudomonas sp.]